MFFLSVDMWRTAMSSLGIENTVEMRQREVSPQVAVDNRNGAL